MPPPAMTKRNLPVLTRSARRLCVMAGSPPLKPPIAITESPLMMAVAASIELGTARIHVSVVRCEPSVVGYRVALEFDPLPAA